MSLFEGRLFFELAPAVQLAHDLGDVHRGGRLPAPWLPLPAVGRTTGLGWSAGAGMNGRLELEGKRWSAERSTGHLVGRGPHPPGRPPPQPREDGA